MWHFRPDSLFRMGTGSAFGKAVPPKGEREADHGTEVPADFENQ